MFTLRLSSPAVILALLFAVVPLNGQVITAAPPDPWDWRTGNGSRYDVGIFGRRNGWFGRRDDDGPMTDCDRHSWNCPVGTCYTGMNGFIGCCSVSSCAVRTTCIDYQTQTIWSRDCDLDTGGCISCKATAPYCVSVTNIVAHQHIQFCGTVKLVSTVSYSNPVTGGSTADMPTVTLTTTTLVHATSTVSATGPPASTQTVVTWPHGTTTTSATVPPTTSPLQSSSVTSKTPLISTTLSTSLTSSVTTAPGSSITGTSASMATSSSTVAAAASKANQDSDEFPVGYIVLISLLGAGLVIFLSVCGFFVRKWHRSLRRQQKELDERTQRNDEREALAKLRRQAGVGNHNPGVNEADSQPAGQVSPELDSNPVSPQNAQDGFGNNRPFTTFSSYPYPGYGQPPNGEEWYPLNQLRPDPTPGQPPYPPQDPTYHDNDLQMHATGTIGSYVTPEQAMAGGLRVERDEDLRQSQYSSNAVLEGGRGR